MQRERSVLVMTDSDFSSHRSVNNCMMLQRQAVTRRESGENEGTLLGVNGCFTSLLPFLIFSI